MKFTKTQIDKLKKEHKHLFKISTEDDKLSAIFREPSRIEYSFYRSEEQSKGTLSIESIANQLYVIGDKEVIEDDGCFNSLKKQIKRLFEPSLVVITQQGDSFECTSLDGKYKCKFRAPTRKEFADFELRYEYEKVFSVENLANTLFVEGDKEIIDEDKYFYSLETQIFDVVPYRVLKVEKL